MYNVKDKVINRTYFRNHIRCLIRPNSYYYFDGYSDRKTIF